VRTAGTLEEFEKRFGQRLRGLAASHDLLVNQDWRGVPLAHLVREQTAFFTGVDDARLEIEGPDVMLAAAVTQTLGLALHELATNAIKYGAWSLPGGKVRVSWDLQRQAGGPAQLRLTWAESGGPPVSPPERNGFGRIVIEDMVAQSTRGEVSTEYAPGGLRWTLSMSTEHVVDVGAVQRTP
jgi:two-component sensor histidine kinase